jgi:diguanylate cyclase (GGDEF)-like protein
MSAGRPGAETSAALDPIHLPRPLPGPLRHARRWVLRLGIAKAVLVLSVAVVLSSLGLVMLSNALMPPPPRFVMFSLVLSVIIPALLAPLVAWLVIRLMFESEHALRVAERLAVTDPLTLVFNRRHFFREGERELALAVTRRSTLSLLLLDVDSFKSVNDLHGHASGDQVLRAVATACNSVLRDHDLLARFGGEEFAMLLPATGPDEAGAIAERVRSAVEALIVPSSGREAIRTTVSIGVASADASSLSLDHLLAHADRAMYLAKRGGRNRVISALVGMQSAATG